MIHHPQSSTFTSASCVPNSFPARLDKKNVMTEMAVHFREI